MTTPFRVLFRHYLFRLTDVEMLSAHAQGDSSKLLGQFAALLIFVGLLFSMPACGGPGKDAHPQARLVWEWSSQHLLISTTMLVVGLFAVLNQESIFPDRRDVFVTGPLPLTARTLFLSKAAAAGAALGLAVGLLHAGAGLVWPIALNAERPEFAAPSFRADPPVAGGDLRSILERDFAPMLAARPEAGIAAGVWRSGSRQVFAFGAAKPDSIFETGSVTKTFTGLLLARMVVEGRARLDEPVRELLPGDIARKPFGPEITLLDLATHRSGLPRMPPGFQPADRPNPFEEFHDADLRAYLSKCGYGKRGAPRFQYSNLGFALLGQALAHRAGRPYAALVEEWIAAPLGLRDTTVALTGEQRSRLVQGYDRHHRPARAWDLDTIAPAGAVHATAGDLLSYAAAQLHPESSGDATLTSALTLARIPRASLGAGVRIALAWLIDPAADRVSHGGATAGYTALAALSPSRDTAVVVLCNTGPSTAISADLIGEHIMARIEGRPAVAIEEVRVPARGGLAGFVRTLAAYWAAMLGSGAFVFCAVLCVQGVALQLPRRLFLRVTPALQLAVFGALIAGYLSQPVAVHPGSVLAAQSGGWQGWSPSYWFLGLLQEWQGSPLMGELARRAWIASAAIGSVTAAVWIAAYFRAVRQIVETPDIAPSAKPRWRLPRCGGSVETALAHFGIRTLARGRQHRLILMFFLGVAFALSIFFLKSPATGRQIDEMAAADPWREPSSPALAATVAIMGFWLLAVRIAGAIPFEMAANWIFRVTPVSTGAMGARRRLLYIALAPCWLSLTAACAAMWPWRAAVGHGLVLALLGAMVAELCAAGPPMIPFTRSWLPGKTGIHVSFWLCAGLLVKLLDTGAIWELRALEDPVHRLPALLAALGSIAVAVRWTTGPNAEDEPRFEDEPADAIVSLGLD